MRLTLRIACTRAAILKTVTLRLATAALAAVAGAAPAIAAEPSIALLTGYGTASFGTSVDDVKKLWPEMEAVANDAHLPSAAFNSPHLQRFLLKGQQIPGLANPVDVEFRFWEGKLWAFLVYFKKADKDAALQHLEKTYGKRITGIDDRPIWTGEKVTLQAVGEAGWYGATDNALSDQARAWFFTALTGNPEGNAPKPPDATPLGAAVPTAAPATTPGS